MRANALVFLHLKFIYDKIKKHVSQSLDGEKNAMGPRIQKRSARTQVTVHTEIELTRTGSIENSADALKV
ncbi:hypothetical protein AKG39_01745 [Acetobacterium bakii]|uniref:Uncharacterized protein n=1 Tax=Acetobacterium bakii TaxID=52689 RepID=A0A0L6U696_9FIRM|nr:hypothetical protein AKG39_01745 [Acetobacterium bakii]